MAGPERETWDKYQKIVLFKLDLLTENVKDLTNKMQRLETELHTMKIEKKVRVSLYSSIGGIIGVIVLKIFEYYQKH